MLDLPLLVMTDIDGVWTDGGMYYDSQGNESKKFNTSDSAGVLFLRSLGIPLAIITGESTSIVEARASKLKIRHVFQGVDDKVAVASSICTTLGVSIAKTAYIGDDLNDLKLLGQVGISGCPSSAQQYVRDRVDIVTNRRGGDGAFREFVEEILSRCGSLDNVLQSFF